MSSSDDVCLIVAKGSEYAIKGLVALDVSGIPYTTYIVDITRLKKILNPPHLVPVLCFNSEVVPDTTDIMKFLDTKLPSPVFFPSPESDVGRLVATTEEEIDSVLSPLLRYFAWYDADGYNRALGPIIRNLFPWGLQWTADWVLRGTRNKMKTFLGQAVPDLDVEDPKAVRQKLDDLLAKYESMFPTAFDTSDDSSRRGPYLCGTERPSSADCGLYAMLQRLVSTSGDSNVPPCLPDLLKPYPALQAYMKRMETEYPVVMLGSKRRPRDAPKPPALVG